MAPWKIELPQQSTLNSQKRTGDRWAQIQYMYVRVYVLEAREYRSFV